MDERLEHDRRPSPEALLRQADQESRGRLKIFLGAAPGVGKTYQMLQTAQAKRREGVDLVVGVVETHGRKETEALLEGLEIVPRRRVEYKGHWLEEMDLDAILERRPQLVLVDELAHTNAPGSRHPKRYMDVEELLGAGIDVYATLNIQHVESLNDVVARITRIRVRETVPDSIIDRADEIEMVDLTPDDLIQRLKEGKVYVPRQAERAIHHYFQPGNLTALRELALRRTAQRVDAQMVDYMRAHAIAGPVGGGRARAGRRQRGPELRGGGSLWPAPGRPPARAVGGDPHRNLAHAAADIGGARPHRRLPAARRTPRRRGPDRAGGERRRRHDRVRPDQQFHACRHRQVAPPALVGMAARFDDAPADPPGRRHQRARHRRTAQRTGRRRRRLAL